MEFPILPAGGSSYLPRSEIQESSSSYRSIDLASDRPQGGNRALILSSVFSIATLALLFFQENVKGLGSTAQSLLACFSGALLGVSLELISKEQSREQIRMISSAFYQTLFYLLTYVDLNAYENDIEEEEELDRKIRIFLLYYGLASMVVPPLMGGVRKVREGEILTEYASFFPEENKPYPVISPKVEAVRVLSLAGWMGLHFFLADFLGERSENPDLRLFFHSFGFLYLGQIIGYVSELGMFYKIYVIDCSQQRTGAASLNAFFNTTMPPASSFLFASVISKHGRQANQRSFITTFFLGVFLRYLGQNQARREENPADKRKEISREGYLDNLGIGSFLSKTAKMAVLFIPPVGTFFTALREMWNASQAGAEDRDITFSSMLGLTVGIVASFPTLWGCLQVVNGERSVYFQTVGDQGEERGLVKRLTDKIRHVFQISLFNPEFFPLTFLPSGTVYFLTTAFYHMNQGESPPRALAVFAWYDYAAFIKQFYLRLSNKESSIRVLSIGEANLIILFLKTIRKD